MTLKMLTALAAVLMAGGATHVARQSSMDWPAFIASVPGTVIGAVEYMTPTLKRSVYRAGTPDLEQTKASFDTWCRARGGKASNMPPLQSTGLAQSFYAAASAWSNQDLVFYGERYSSMSQFCFDAQQQLTTVMMVRTYGGNRNRPYEPDKSLAPVIAFYTPEQAVQFADFYNAKEKERAETSRRNLQQSLDREALETRRLRVEPKIGDSAIQ